MIILGIQHLVGCAQSALAYCPYVHIPYSHYAGKYIGDVLMRVRIVKYAFVALAPGTRLVGVYPGYYKYLIFDLIRNLCKSCHVIAYRVLTVCRTRTYYQYHPFVFARYYLLCRQVSFILYLLTLSREMRQRFDLFFAHYLLYFLKHLSILFV